jgi:hypothetical protein
MFVEVRDGYLRATPMVGQPMEFEIGQEQELSEFLSECGEEDLQCSSSVWGIWDELLQGALKMKGG